MRFISACLMLLVLGWEEASAASAFAALQLLRAEDARNVAIIVGRDGTPQPERWRFLVYDPQQASGLREIVVADAKVTTDRPFSQFADTIAAGQAIGSELLKIDSDQVIKLALQFGHANGVSISAMHFDVRRRGLDAAPLWMVTCLDAGGAELGKIVVSAVNGAVIVHPGFAIKPQLEPVATAAVPALAAGETRTATRKPSAPKKRAATPVPASAATPKPSLFRRMFGGGNNP